MVLVIIGIVKLQDGASVGTTLMKAGMGVVLACWVVLALWTLASFRSHQGYTAVGVPADGTKVRTISIIPRIHLIADSCSMALRWPFHSLRSDKYLLQAHSSRHRLVSRRLLRPRSALELFLKFSRSSSSRLREYAHVASQISIMELRNKWRM